MTANLSAIYGLLLNYEQSRRAISKGELDEYQHEKNESSAELESDLAAFNLCVKELSSSLAQGDADATLRALVNLRIYSMNVSAIFSNLADTLATSIKKVDTGSE